MKQENMSLREKVSVLVKEVVKSNKFTKSLYAIGGIIIILLIFQAGVFVGFKKAEFSNRWAGKFRETFGSRNFGHMKMMGGDYLTSHGAVGKIIKIELPKIFIIGADNVEKSVVIDDDTLIRVMRENIFSTSLKTGDDIIIIGSPNNSGEILAKLVRVVPSMMNLGTTTTK